MSNMLEQAIIDATALKEAAMKHAETAILEKYSGQIKEAITTILEQPEGEEMGMGAPADAEAAVEAPLAATDDEKLCPCPDEEEEVEINFDELAKQIEAEEEMAPGEMTDREEFAEEEIELTEAMLKEVLEEEEEELKEDEETLEETSDQGEASDLVAEVEDEETLNLSMEDLKEVLAEEEEEEDYTPPEAPKEKETEHPGFKGGLQDQPYNRDDEEEELKEEAETDNLTSEIEEIKQKYESLNEENNQYKNVVLQLKEKLDEINLSNAKLLYTNRVLSSASLNERQKKQLVEAISSASTIEEAKVIYDTLQSAVGSSSQRKTPKSLNEAVTKNSSTFISQRSQQKTADPAMNRLKRLAGLE